MRAFPGTEGLHRTPVALGFLLPGLNLALMCSWALSMVAALCGFGLAFGAGRIVARITNDAT